MREFVETKKSKRKVLLERISPYIEQNARDYYSGALEKGFRHWAFSEVFIQEDFSDDDVISNTLIDGPDDCGVDGYFIDHALRTIHLFQSKYESGSLEEDTLTYFHESPCRVIDTNSLAKCRNDETKKLAYEITKYIPEGYGIHMVIASAGVMTPSATVFVERNKASNLRMGISDSQYDVPTEFNAYDIKGLVELFEQHLSWLGVVVPDVELNLIPGYYHDVREKYNCMKATILATEVVRIFNEHGFNIFRLNPRGPLANKINKDMYDYLKDEVYRPIFHLLNNGLSITCDSYTLKGDMLMVRNFQIVNGCQTTVTLDKAKNFLREEVRIDIKVTECPTASLAREIAQTTNTQAGLKAQDFISADTRQLELQKQFASLQEPWFYEIRRGEWVRMVGPQDKRKFKRPDGTYRLLRIKDVAQAALAFIGMPGEAKDHTKTIFQHKESDLDVQAHYEDIFRKDITAKQLLFYWLIFSQIKSIVAEENTISDFPGYGRLHSVWLTGELIRMKYGLKKEETFPVSLSTLLTDTMSKWFVSLYFLVKETLRMAVEEERTIRGDIYSNREFFRGTRLNIANKLPVAISYATSFGPGSPLEKLPRWKS